MTNLQNEFLDFDGKIKLSYDENAELREKRDILLRKLKDNICGESAPFISFNQGSYAMKTGIKPDSGDYDIDVGLRFSLKRSDSRIVFSSEINISSGFSKNSKIFLGLLLENPIQSCSHIHNITLSFKNNHHFSKKIFQIVFC